MKIEELKLAQDELQREDTYWCYTPTEFVCKGGELQLAKIQRKAEQKPILFVGKRWKVEQSPIIKRFRLVGIDEHCKNVYTEEYEQIEVMR